MQHFKNVLYKTIAFNLLFLDIAVLQAPRQKKMGYQNIITDVIIVSLSLFIINTLLNIGPV